MNIAIVTGASRGLGLALSRALAERGWTLIVDARGASALSAAAQTLSTGISTSRGGVEIGDELHGRVIALSGDVADASHRAALVDAAARLGGLDLLVNNASLLGPSPQPRLADYPLDVLADVYRVNTIAPLALTQAALPLLRRSRGRVLNITSDASVEAYEGWGGYGSSKAALDQWSRVLAAEEPAVRVYAVDPGDMRTQMHQEAFPGEDISDRPLPEESVPALLRLIEGDEPSGRVKAADLREGAAV